MDVEIKKRENLDIPKTCKSCDNPACEKLYWEDIVVIPDYFAVPIDCPLLLNDKDLIIEELDKLETYDVSNISEEVWLAHNFNSRPIFGSNRKADEITHIIRHWRNEKCIVLGKAENPWYKPWSMFGVWTTFADGPLPELPHAETTSSEEDYESEQTQQAPLKITSVKWEHTDQARKDESPDTVVNGDIIKLIANFENFVEGARVDFYLYGKRDSNEKLSEKLHSRCESMSSTIEWTVDLYNVDEADPQLQFEVKARDLVSERCGIGTNISINFRLNIQINPNDEDSQDDTFRLFSTDDACTYDQTLTIKDDKVPDDNSLTLEFTNIDNKLKYTLEVNPGAQGNIYFPFEDKALGDL